MPKKFVGENSKAVAARARKAAVKEAESAKKQQEIENQLWQDNDKQLVRKQQKKEEQELKKQEQLKKKAEAKALLEQEMNSLKISKPPVAKLTRAQINSVSEKHTNESSTNKIPSHIEIPLEENINRIIIEGEVASNVDEAINILKNSNVVEDKHPEKRMKAAYTAFEEKMMPQLKADNPTLRLSQLKQLLRKEWMKSSENPLNQRLQTS